jgi:hypothetical protein
MDAGGCDKLEIFFSCIYRECPSPRILIRHAKTDGFWGGMDAYR